MDAQINSLLPPVLWRRTHFSDLVSLQHRYLHDRLLFLLICLTDSPLIFIFLTISTHVSCQLRQLLTSRTCLYRVSKCRYDMYSLEEVLIVDSPDEVLQEEEVEANPVRQEGLTVN